MSLIICVAHSGQKLAPDPAKVSSLDALRSWVQHAAAIQASKQVFLTSKGKSVRPQTLLTETEIYVFDSSLLAPSAANSKQKPSSLVADPEPFNVGKPPDQLSDLRDLQSWKSLFRDRLEWATGLRSTCASLATRAAQYADEQVVIERSLNAAAMSLQIHNRGAEQKHQAAEAWADGLLKQQELHIDNWDTDLDRLSRIPANLRFARFIQAQDVASAADAHLAADATLRDFVDVHQVKKAAASARDIMTRFAQRVVDLRSLLATTGKQSEHLLLAVEHMQNGESTVADDEPAKLMDEVDIIYNKLLRDMETLGTLSADNQGASKASKMALLHTRNFLPNLIEFCVELNDLLRRTIQQRNNAAEMAMQHMQTLASIESRLSEVYTDIKTLDMPSEEQHVFNQLNVLSRLPFVYGSLLVEAVRRLEWTEKMKKDSSTLAEEMATYQEEEERRRKKWLNSIDDVVKPELVKAKPLGVEVNLHSDEINWPNVVRQDLHNYIRSLQNLDLPSAVSEDLVQAVKELDRPTKKQIKHAKNFKNGSMHEAAFGATSLMLRGEDEYKVLQDANTKLEEELKGQKSRVRKLEDLLHRQAQMSRMTSTDTFRPQIELMSDITTPPPASPIPAEPMIRQASVGSRRTSSSLGNEEKRLGRRIIMLEADLQAAKDQNALLERDVQAKEQTEAERTHQIEEAVSTKKDIMKNMEAQQREFANERRTLEQELGLARTRIEEIEDEFDRVLGSRDQERSGIDAKARALEIELEKMRLDAVDVENKHNLELEGMKKTMQAQHDQIQSYKEQLQTATSTKEKTEKIAQRLRSDLEANDQAQSEQVARLTAAHRHLSPNTEPPQKYLDLASVMEELARKSTAHVKDLADAVAMAKSDNDSLRSQHEARLKELTAATGRYAVFEAEIIRLKDELASEQAHSSSFASCLEDEREQLRSLRSKFADGETGADVLRQRVVEEETRVVRLSDQLAEARSHERSMDVELMRVQSKLNSAQKELNTASDRLKLRGTRAKEITQKLYAHNARLLRLLEALGFVVSYKDGAMIIERASKIGASTTLVNASTVMDRTVSLSSPPGTRKTSLAVEAPSPLAFLQWTDSTSPSDEESQYSSFMEATSLFSIDTFAEAIAKRLRDFEYTARKWQKEARNYKDKSARLSFEGSAKIAVKDFKEGDLALFLPTKGKHMGAWAAFNINAPHHFLHEKEGMNLQRREWLVARISKVEERIVDLSKPPAPSNSSMRSIGSTSVDAASLDENDNPFELSDGLTWYLVHAAEDKAGAPSTPGLGKSTVAGSAIDARGSIRLKKKGEGEAAKTLGKSLDSRRSSSNSKKGVSPGFPSGSAQAQRSTSVASADISVPERADGKSVESTRGLGIIADTSEPASSEAEAAGDDETDSGKQLLRAHRSSSSPHKPLPAALSPTKPLPLPMHPRSASPSKSIRSLARHLDPAPSAASSAATAAATPHPESPQTPAGKGRVNVLASPSKAPSPAGGKPRSSSAQPSPQKSPLRKGDGASGSASVTAKPGGGNSSGGGGGGGLFNLFSGQWEQKL
ncbi:hypothetical protein MBLNU459_g1116t2 [Dothideomycetes sp. NU459]